MKHCKRLLTAVIGVVSAGAIPKEPLKSDRDDIRGPFWTAWSVDFGCIEMDLNPFGPDGKSAEQLFCRNRPANLGSSFDSMKWKICTLPDINSKKTGFVYGNDSVTVNAYYSQKEGTQPKISSKLLDQAELKKIKYFDGFYEEKVVWNDTRPPAGDNAEIPGWRFKDLYKNTDRKNVYKNNDIYSTRIACDPRLENAAKVCYDGGFNTEGKMLIQDYPFCDSWALDDIKEKHHAAGCSGSIGIVSKRGDSEYPIREALVLLIEDKLEKSDDEWVDYIPAGYEKKRQLRGTCSHKCPTPAVWSSWSCYCAPNLAENPGLTNVAELPICSNSTTRHRIQTCTKTESWSCEIYEVGDPVFDRCEKMGNAQILGESNNVVKVNGKTPRYGYSSLKWLLLGDIMNYNKTLSVEGVVDRFYESKSALTDQCSATWQQNPVSEGDFKDEIEQSTGRFTFAVDTDMCLYPGVTVRVRETPCLLPCGCEFFDRITECIFLNGTLVPETSFEYIYCSPRTVEKIRCPLPCCAAWYQCNSVIHDGASCGITGNSCAKDSDFTKVLDTLINKQCSRPCGTEIMSREFRCMCKDECVNPVGDITTRYNISECSVTIQKPEIWEKLHSAVENQIDYAIPIADIKDTNYDAVVYRKILYEPCTHKCCVKMHKTDKECPKLDCYSDDLLMPWFLNITKVDGEYVCRLNPSIYANDLLCKCEAASCVAQCTHGNKMYNEGEIFPQDHAIADKCEYTRKDHINYNKITNDIKGKGDYDPYICCTEDNEHLIFNEWSRFSSCGFVDKKVDNKGCGCTDNVDEACGMKTRRRTSRCPTYAVDDTTCPCIETETCDMPLCPIQGDFTGYTTVCELNPKYVGTSVSYKVRHCVARDHTPIYSLTDYYKSDQYIGLNGCSWCSCETQVQRVPSSLACPSFDITCLGLSWNEWGRCTVVNNTCGAGTRTRYRSCEGVTTMEEAETLCYNTRVKRTMARDKQLSMKNNTEYFESQDCHIPCSDDLVNWSEWSACANALGNGLQVRREIGKVENVEVRACVLDPATAKSEPRYTQCSNICGEGKRQKVVYNFDTKNMEVTIEVCKLAECVAEVDECPANPVISPTTESKLSIQSTISTLSPGLIQSTISTLSPGLIQSTISTLSPGPALSTMPTLSTSPSSTPVVDEPTSQSVLKTSSFAKLTELSTFMMSLMLMFSII